MQVTLSVVLPLVDFMDSKKIDPVVVLSGARVVCDSSAGWFWWEALHQVVFVCLAPRVTRAPSGGEAKPSEVRCCNTLHGTITLQPHCAFVDGSLC